jgi:hypothetical protein
MFVEWVALGIDGTCVIRYSKHDKEMRTYIQLSPHYPDLRKWLFREDCEPIVCELSILYKHQTCSFDKD